MNIYVTINSAVSISLLFFLAAGRGNFARLEAKKSEPLHAQIK